jgi:hypothetical protein
VGFSEAKLNSRFINSLLFGGQQIWRITSVAKADFTIQRYFREQTLHLMTIYMDDKVEDACRHIREDMSPFYGIGKACWIVHDYLKCGDFDSADRIISRLGVYPKLFMLNPPEPRESILNYITENTARWPRIWDGSSIYDLERLAVFRRVRRIDLSKQHPLFRKDHFESEAAQLQFLSLRVSQLSLKQVAARAISLASPTELGGMPSSTNAKKAFEAADLWLHMARDIEPTSGNSNVTLEIPLALYVNLAIHAQEFENANRELENIEPSNRNKWMKANLGQDILNEHLSVAISCSKSSDIAQAVKIAETMKARFELGRQEVMPDTSMADLVEQLVQVSWDVWEDKYRQFGLNSKAGLTFPPATEQEIEQVEVKTGISLPADYKELLRVTNGCD